jgi:L-ascorbate 6-phosphate lactonase
VVSRGALRDIYRHGETLAREIQSIPPPPDGVAFWFLGQSGIVIKSPRKGLEIAGATVGDSYDGGAVSELLVVDPYLTFSIEEESPGTEFVRTFPPPIEPDALVGAVALLVTHFHGDHMDLQTIRLLTGASPATEVVVPSPAAPLVRESGVDFARVRRARDGEAMALGQFRIDPVAVPHTSYETGENGDAVFLGYGIVANGVRLFHAGDCVSDPGMAERVRDFRPDILFLPINGRDAARTARDIVGNMNYREAADFGVAVGADLIVPVHHDLFPNNTENPAYFVDYLFHVYPSQKFHMMTAGELFLYSSPDAGR